MFWTTVENNWPPGQSGPSNKPTTIIWHFKCIVRQASLLKASFWCVREIKKNSLGGNVTLPRNRLFSGGYHFTYQIADWRSQSYKCQGSRTWPKVTLPPSSSLTWGIALLSVWALMRIYRSPASQWTVCQVVHSHGLHRPDASSYQEHNRQRTAEFCWGPLCGPHPQYITSCHEPCATVTVSYWTSVWATINIFRRRWGISVIPDMSRLTYSLTYLPICRRAIQI